VGERGSLSSANFSSLRWCSKRTRQPTLLRRIHHSLAQGPRAAVYLLAADMSLACSMAASAWTTLAFIVVLHSLSSSAVDALLHANDVSRVSSTPHLPKAVLYMAACAPTNSKSGRLLMSAHLLAPNWPWILGHRAPR